MRLLLLFLAAAPILRAAEPDTLPKGPVHAVHTADPINIDGILDEQVWKNDDGYTAFTQREPVENGTPSQKTVVHIAYDDAAVYVGARCYDSAADSMTVRLSRRDGTWTSDMFFFYVDPYHDRTSGFYFALDAAGTLYDGTLMNDESNDDSWDGVWEGKVTRDAQGWTAEMRIPFSQLRFQQSANYVWGVNFRRDIARRNERDYVVFTPVNGSGFVSRFVDLTGIENISPSHQLEVLPYVTTQAEYSSRPAGDPFNSGSKYTPRVGGDIKAGLGSNLTLNGTVLPDFGQVEVDPAVVNLSDVETSFQEKRPFFIEGSSVFSFGQGGTNNNWSFNWPGVTFLYSRRIGRAPQGSLPSAQYADVPTGTDILGAAKLTGKVGDNWSVGAIEAVTAREFGEVQTDGARSRVELEPLASYGVARALKQFRDGRDALGFFTSGAVRSFQDDRLRDEIDKDGLIGGVDGWATLDSARTWVVGWWGALSRVSGSRARITSLQENSARYFQRPDQSYLSVDTNAESMTGAAGRIRLNKQKGNFYLNASLGVLNPRFEPNDLGFMSRADVVNTHLVMSYRWTEPRSWYRYIELGGAAFRSYDFGGDITWEGLFHFGYIELPNFYQINWNYAYNPPTVSTHRTRGGPSMVMPPGYQIDFYPVSPQKNNFVFSFEWFTYQAEYQRDWYVAPSVEWRPSTNVSITFSPLFEHDQENAQYVGTAADPAATQTYGTRYIFGEMNQNTLSASVRLNWTFTPQLSLQIYAQPLISAGDFRNFKELALPHSYRFDSYNGAISYSDSANAYTVALPGAKAFSFDNPSFNYRSLRGNAVLRWEYMPGSTAYFVWTQSRSDQDVTGDFQFRRSLGALMDAQPDNIFMVKLSYWWPL